MKGQGTEYLWIPSNSIDGQCSPRLLDLVKKLHGEDPSRRVLLVRPVPERVVRIGAAPPAETLIREELARRGIPRDAVVVLPGPARNFWEECRCVAQWQTDRVAGNQEQGEQGARSQHENAKGDEVCLVCDRFKSGRFRLVMRRSAGAEKLAGVRIVSVANASYDETSWWQCRSGVKDFVGAWLAQIYIRCHGEDILADDRWDPDEYEREIR